MNPDPAAAPGLRKSACGRGFRGACYHEAVGDTSPLADPLRHGRAARSAAIVIFGANGDLTRRMLVPALYRLAYERRLPAGFAVLGVSRTPMPDEVFRETMKEAVQAHLENSPFDQELWSAFSESLFYLSGDIGEEETYRALGRRLAEIEAERGTEGNVLFYMSIAPSQYERAVQGIASAGLSEAPGNAWRRIVVEKPFGRDLSSARQLNKTISAAFPESSIYRIDHYLGKETVQNILAFRFGNGIFEPLWNRRYVNHVQVTAAESIGVEGRGAYYEESGALRDMIQNHLLQVLATVAMEPPSEFAAEAVRDERAKLLKAVRRMTAQEAELEAVRGQYSRARVGGEDVAGFREEPGVSPDSTTETYAALTLFIDNWRWAGVPFYVRTGKRLPKRVTDIAVEFHRAPLPLFGRGNGEQWPNLLVLRIQPEEGISLRFLSKTPGAHRTLRPVMMDFNYGSSFGMRTPSAYETLLLDALEGDATLYTRQDMVEASWEIVQPVLDAWQASGAAPPAYPAGTWGPAEADAMLERRGHRWRIP